MPATPLNDLLLSLASASPNGTNVSSAVQPVQVICAWPLSGQYGPGSRVLYYFLVAACILARKAEWLRSACLAAALLWPAVAAIHAIALTALHQDTAIDMDIYGTFQLCSIAVLTAPVVVRLSKTYFFDPGRNIIFLWTFLLLAGLLSLTVEFYRTNSFPCSTDSDGNTFPDINHFPYGDNGTCGVICDTTRGPFSPMRGGAQNNIYVVPAPYILNFGTATLICGACCVPSVLSLIFMWEKIIEINWKKRVAPEKEKEKEKEKMTEDGVIEGTNGATPATMKRINSVIKGFLEVLEVPLFAVAVMTILIWGEINLFSYPVFYETEPPASVGQWAPIVGTGLAAAGSLYIYIAHSGETDTQSQHGKQPCTCCDHHHRQPSASDLGSPPTSPDGLGLTLTMSPGPEIVPEAGRAAVAKWLTSVGTYLGTRAEDREARSGFIRGGEPDFPTIPGERYRNPDIEGIIRQYNGEGEEIHRLRSRSRLRSSSNASGTGLGIDVSRDRSPLREPPSPTRASASSPQPLRSQSLPVPRSDLLEVPSAVHLAGSRPP